MQTRIFTTTYRSASAPISRILALVITASIVGCDSQNIASDEVGVEGRALSALTVSEIHQKSLSRHSLPRTVYMADIHTAAMQDWASRVGAVRKMPKQERCRELASLTRRQFASVARATGVNDHRVLEQALGGSLRNLGCAVQPMMLTPIIMPSFSVAATEDSVTGAFLAYGNDLEYAVQSASNPASAAANLDAVLGQAQGNIPAADFEVLSGLAQMGISSVYYWDSYTGGGGGGGGGNPDFSMFMFGCCYIAKIDIIGAVAGAAGALQFSGGTVIVNPPALLAGSLIWGLGSSAAALLAQ